jgi:hypothetical protein
VSLLVLLIQSMVAVGARSVPIAMLGAAVGIVVITWATTQLRRPPPRAPLSRSSLQALFLACYGGLVFGLRGINGPTEVFVNAILVSTVCGLIAVGVTTMRRRRAARHRSIDVVAPPDEPS